MRKRSILYQKTQFKDVYKRQAFMLVKELSPEKINSGEKLLLFTVHFFYWIKNFTLYNPEYFINVKLMVHKIIQACTGDQCLNIMDTVQKIRLTAAVQL